MHLLLVGGLEHDFCFPIYWEYSSQLTFIFFRGVAQPPIRLSFIGSRSLLKLLFHDFGQACDSAVGAASSTDAIGLQDPVAAEVRNCIILLGSKSVKGKVQANNMTQYVGAEHTLYIP